MAKKIMLKDLVAIQAGCTIDAAERKILAGEVFSGNARLTHPGEKFDGWCQTLLLDSQKSLLFLCKREVLSRRECFRT